MSSPGSRCRPRGDERIPGDGERSRSLPAVNPAEADRLWPTRLALPGRRSGGLLADYAEPGWSTSVFRWTCTSGRRGLVREVEGRPIRGCVGRV